MTLLPDDGKQRGGEQVSAGRASKVLVRFVERDDLAAVRLLEEEACWSVQCDSRMDKPRQMLKSELARDESMKGSVRLLNQPRA